MIISIHQKNPYLKKIFKSIWSIATCIYFWINLLMFMTKVFYNKSKYGFFPVLIYTIPMIIIVILTNEDKREYLLMK